MDLKDLHEEIYQFLLEKRKQDPSLRFLLRKNDKDNKLNDGFWFLGSDREQKIYITFWNVYDNARYKNLAIRFEVETNGNSCLNFNVKGLGDFKGLKENLNLKKNEDTEYLRHLEHFIMVEKPFIDSFIKLKGFSDDFPPIPESEFIARLGKIENIRQGRKAALFNSLFDNKLIINALQLKSISVFKSLNLTFDKQITCFVGGNGSGKTTILRTIALGLVGSTSFNTSEIDILTIEEAKNDKKKYADNGEITVFYDINKTPKSNTVSFKALDNGRVFKMNGGTGILKEDDFLEALIVGFAQQTKTQATTKNAEYTPNIKDVRPLIINQSENRFNEFSEWLHRLLNADTIKEKETNRLLIERILYVINHITDDNIELVSKTQTDVKTKNNPSGIPLALLSQGYQNVLTWVGIFMKRMWEYAQSLPIFEDESFDFKELPAVCLIDEIDTYLHPDWQYTILSGLVESFPNVQFFITSHSPFVLTSVPAEKITIYELNTEGGGIIVKELQENLYGADANRATDAISDERLSAVKEKFAVLRALIQGNELDKAEKMLDEEFELLEPSDPDIVAARSRISTKRMFQKK